MTSCAREPALIVLYRGTKPNSGGFELCERCLFVNIAEAARFRRPPQGVEGIIVEGHADPPAEILDLAADEFALVVARIDPAPRFLILNMCFGPEVEFLETLHGRGVEPGVIVAVAARIPLTGMVFDSELFTRPAVESENIAAYVSCCALGKSPLTIIRRGATPKITAAAREVRKAIRSCSFLPESRSRSPNLVPVQEPLPFSGNTVGLSDFVEGPILVSVPAEEWCQACY